MSSSNKLPTITSDIPRDLRLFLDRVRDRMADLDKAEAEIIAIKKGTVDLYVRSTGGTFVSVRKMNEKLLALQRAAEQRKVVIDDDETGDT